MNKIYEMKKLIHKLNYWTQLYDEGHPEVSDAEWDENYFKLISLEDETGVYLEDSPSQKIIYTTVNQLKKVEHNHPMLSLAKTKDLKEVESFIEDRDYIAMCKMDGLTCSLRYVDGKLVSAETRGNGLIGEDILHNALVIPSIPKRIPYKNELIVDGEIICTKSSFEPFKKKYKNPRNFAAGSIRLLDSKECEKRSLTFVAWDVIKGFEEKEDYLHNCFFLLDTLGFNIVPYIGFLDSWEAEIEELKHTAKLLGYPIDGVVFKFDSRKYGKELGRTDHHFKNAIAYKFYDETYSTELRKIEWTMGRTGVLTPVAVFDPVDIDGSMVERASLHNVSIIHEVLGLYPYKHQPIEIYKANMIIPQIASAKKLLTNENGKIIASEDSRVAVWGNNDYFATIEHIKNCPCCGEPLLVTASSNGVLNLTCPNPDCEGKLVNKLDHFCGKKGLDIKGLSKATLGKLIDLGWVNNCEDIFTLNQHSKEWMDLPGFGEKSVNKILAAIEESKHCTLNRFIAALGIPLIGNTAAKALANYFPTWENFMGAIDGRYEFSLLSNFGYEMEKSLNQFDYSEAKRIYSFLDIQEVKEPVKENTLDGLSIVITGKLQQYKNRDSLKADIEAHGGKVSGSISKKTSYLINNDNASTSAKNKAAIAANIPILTESEFIEKFLTK